MKTREIAEFLNAELSGDGDVEIERVAAVAGATMGEIAFVDKADAEIETKASCLIVPLDFSDSPSPSIIRSANPKLAFSRIAAILHPTTKPAPRIHSSALRSEEHTSELQSRFGI